MFKSKLFLIWGIFFSGIIIFMALEYLFFALNDYEWLENIENLNKRRKAHNIQVDKTR